MNRFLFLCVLYAQISTAQVAPKTPYSQYNNGENDWFLAFEDNFNYILKDTLEKNWVLQDGEKKYIVESVFTKDQVALENESLLALKIKRYDSITPFINPHSIPEGMRYTNGNGKAAYFAGSELYTRKQFLYGYIEARIKFPSGKGTGSAIWMFPNYREREYHASGGAFPNGYPEEMDILEHRSIIDANYEHVHDFCTFWNNNCSNNCQTIDAEAWDTSEMQIAGTWHTFALRWDLFNQYYYIDGEIWLLEGTDLWRRATNTESMNLVISHAISTDTTDPSRCPDGYDHSGFESNVMHGYQIKFPSRAIARGGIITDPDNVEGNKVYVDWVKVWQQKKFRNPVVWASGKSGKLGDFKLQSSASTTAFDTFITGDFIAGGADEVLSISQVTVNSNQSALQELTSKKSISIKTPNDVNPHTDDFQDVWDVKTISKEIGNGSAYTANGLNGWFANNAKYCVGNFDGIAGDELFINNNTGWSVVKKFTAPSIPGSGHVMTEKFAQQNSISTITNTNASIVWQNHAQDRFYSGNFNGTGGDELFIVNPTTKKYTILTKTNLTDPSIAWKNLNYKSTGTNALTFGNSWTVSSDDEYYIDNFLADTAQEELLCINKSTGNVALFAFAETPSNSSDPFTKVWDNTSAIPQKKINDWWMSPSDSFLSSVFLKNGKTQLLCINQNQSYAHLYEFNKVNNVVICKTKQQNHPESNTPEKLQYLKYKYENNQVLQNTLLTIERYRNPNGCGAVNGVLPDCTKYFSALVGFDQPVGSNPIYAKSDTNNIEATTQQETHLKIYPNPAKNSFKIDFSHPESGSYVLFNMLGKKIKWGNIQDATSTEVDISDKSKGIYFIKIDTQNFNTTEKIIVN